LPCSAPHLAAVDRQRHRVLADLYDNRISVERETVAKRSDASLLLKPVAPPRNLTHAIAERIAAEIVGGKFSPGARLPTEQEMGNAMGGSRTVGRGGGAAVAAAGV